jgi:RNA polymerase sigma-70 factor, ECF subfamily
MPTDTELLMASGQGDRQAFALLVEQYHRAVIQFIGRFLATENQATAEDLAQQVFLSVWRYAPAFQPRVKVVTWLLRIATNACLNYRRHEKLRIPAMRPERSVGAGQDQTSDSAEQRLTQAERAGQIRIAIAELPPNQRAAIVLRYFHDFTYAEIGQALGASISAVDSLLHRARRALSDKLISKKD